MTLFTTTAELKASSIPEPLLHEVLSAMTLFPTIGDEELMKTPPPEYWLSNVEEPC